MSINPLEILIIIFALGGFFLARYIWRHKNKNKHPLVCPLNFKCDPVIHSDFSSFLGVKVEVLGMFYYGFVTVAYAFFIFLRPDLFSSTVSIFLLTLSASAFLFSVYLLFIQAFALKQWCSWCLVSTTLCFLIFGISVIQYL